MDSTFSMNGALRIGLELKNNAPFVNKVWMKYEEFDLTISFFFNISP